MVKPYLSDEKIVNYNDIVLRRSDVDILSGPHFLNDLIIEFYFSFLTSCYPSEESLLIPPAIAFWITKCPADSVKDFVGPLTLSDRKLVIFPINDNDDVTKAEGGTHWSLLAFERDANVFVHHDSFGGHNKSYAKELYEAVAPHMGISNTAPSASYLDCFDTPQQMNGYDCGLYVIAIARAICRWYESSGPKDEEGLWVSAVKDEVNQSVVSGMRNEILGLIRSLSERN